MTPQPDTLVAGSLAGEDGVARWRQIAGALRAEIVAGAHEPGSRLPTELQLAARFGVNRHTVRRAIDELARAGLVQVEQGRGSFVAEDVLDYEVQPRTRFSEWIRRHNKEPAGQALALAEGVADAAVAAALGIPEGAAVVRHERLELADGRPVCLATRYFPADRLPGLAAALAAEETISGALARAGVADYRRLVTRVTARLPQSGEAKLLRVPRGRPLLVAENINVDPAGAAVEFCLACYPTPRVQIVFEP